MNHGIDQRGNQHFLWQFLNLKGSTTYCRFSKRARDFYGFIQSFVVNDQGPYLFDL